MNKPRFIIRAHPFIDDALLIIDRTNGERDWTKASESIVTKAARDVETHGATLGDVIGIADHRTRRLIPLLNRRRIREARRRSNEIADAAQEAYEIAHQ